MNKNEYMAMSLPYGLKIKSQHQIFILHAYIDSVEVPSDYDHISIGNVISENEHEENVREHHKPILRPLSDLAKEIEHNGEKFLPWMNLANNGWSSPDIMFYPNTTINPDTLPFFIIQKLIEWHFDICGLIEKGEAINYHTLPDFVF